MLAVLALALSCAGCMDRSPTAAVPPDGPPKLLGLVACTVDVARETVVCEEPAPGGNGVSLALLGTNQIKMRSANNVSDTAAQVFSFEATAQNLLTYSIGTPDGHTKTGLKVFFETGPTVTAYYSPGDTGSVTVRNPDGYQNFTGPQQPYHFYDTILPPQGITEPKRWEYNVPRTVQRFGFTVRMFTTTPKEQRVPMRAPEGEPSWFYAPENSVPCTGLLTGPCLPDVISVEFIPASSQEERQSALDVIGGTVVGGSSGMYHVRIPRDTTLSRMRQTLQHLRRLPQVRYAAPFSTALGSVDHLSPYDGVHWREWKLDPDSADGRNWALEQINAPMAWGCSVGDTTTRIGVVDDGFFSVMDLAKQSRSATYGYPSVGLTRDDHGTRVTGVVAAYGNDSSQISGVMWRARLVLRDVAVDSAGVRYQTGPRFPINRLWRQILTAGRSGARVINLSVGFPWPSNPAAETDSLVRMSNEAMVTDWYRRFKATMDTLAAEGHRPLVVFSAGNQGSAGIDTRWNVARVAADSSDQFGQAYNVLIVGASTPSQALASFTNPGALVAIAAPGAGVIVVHGNGLVDSVDATRPAPYSKHTGFGTSFAAPHVSGVAGLLFSFDPRLTADVVKALILEGARRGGRTAGGIPILNAYESLKLAAQRPGARLCGNRLWSTGGTGPLLAERSSGPEQIVGTVSNSSELTTFHTGRAVRGRSSSYITWRHDPMGWFQSPGTLADEKLTSGVTRGAQGIMHDSDTTAVPSLIGAPSNDAAPTDILVEIWSDRRFAPGSQVVRTLATIPLPPLQRDAGDFCTQGGTNFSPREWYCVSSAPAGVREHAGPHAVFAPRGNYVYVIDNSIRYEFLSTGTFACGSDPYVGTCHTVAMNKYSRGVVVYRVRVSDGQWVPLWTIPDVNLVKAVISEAGDELAALSIRTSEGQTVPYQTTCDIRFFDLATGQVKMEGPNCNYPYLHHPTAFATFSP